MEKTEEAEREKTEQNNMLLDIAEFNPTVAELQRLADEARAITVTDFADEAQLKVCKAKRIELRNARVVVEKKGKQMREEAILFQKAVIGKQNELIGIISPEEDRLQALEDEAVRLIELEQRKAVLPVRKEKLAEIKDGVEVSDEELLKMDAPAFQEYLNNRIGAKNEADRLALRKKEDEIEQEQQRQRAEAERIRQDKIKARSERLFGLGLKSNGRAFTYEGQPADFILYDEVGTVTDEQWEALMSQALPKIDQMRVDAEARRKQAIEDAEARGRKEAEERAERERLAEEERQRKEKERLEKEEAYRMWLESNSFDKENCILKDEGAEVVMYRRVSSFKK